MQFTKRVLINTYYTVCFLKREVMFSSSTQSRKCRIWVVYLLLLSTLTVHEPSEWTNLFRRHWMRRRFAASFLWTFPEASRPGKRFNFPAFSFPFRFFPFPTFSALFSNPRENTAGLLEQLVFFLVLFWIGSDLKRGTVWKQRKCKPGTWRGPTAWRGRSGLWIRPPVKKVSATRNGLLLLGTRKFVFFYFSIFVFKFFCFVGFWYFDSCV